jgi:tetratricopeptide (TPR) repeat protein
MRTIASSVLALGLALGPMHALAQVAPAPADAPSTSAPYDLPAGPEPLVRGVVPGIGPTPGVILTADTPAAKCSRDATKAADGLMAPQDAVETCNAAIVSGIGPTEDLVGSLVNRGVLLMTMLQPQHAKEDFNRALAVDSEQAEALVNRGAILLSEGDVQQALADLNRGIALGPERPERAYYTRAVAREDAKDIRGAYEDYKTAEALKPGWELVVQELSRFRVQRK